MKPFDPKQFEKDKKTVKAGQESEKQAAARMAARAPKAAAKAKPEGLTEKVVFGLGSRKAMANRLSGK